MHMSQENVFISNPFVVTMYFAGKVYIYMHVFVWSILKVCILRV